MPTDYIMRMIEEFFRLLRNIIMKREQADYEMAREGLDNLSKMITGLDLMQIKLLADDGLTFFFNPDKQDYAEKIFCTGKMFKEEALINEAEGKQDESVKSNRYALTFFEKIKEKDSEYKQEVLEEIIQLNNKIRGLAG